jgi:hypothetical protein
MQCSYTRLMSSIYKFPLAGKTPISSIFSALSFLSFIFFLYSLTHMVLWHRSILSHAHYGHINIPITHSVGSLFHNECLSLEYTWPQVCNFLQMRYVPRDIFSLLWAQGLFPAQSHSAHTPTSAGTQSCRGPSHTSGLSLMISRGTGDRKGGGDTSKSSVLHPHLKKIVFLNFFLPLW